MIGAKIEESINRFSSNNDYDPRFIVMDSESYFELKIEEFGDADAAIFNELETFLGLRVFHNSLGYSFIDIA